MNPFKGPADYAAQDFLADVEAIDRMLATDAPARLPEPEPLVVVDEATGVARLVPIRTDTASYRVYAYFVDKYGEPGLRRHVVYFGVLRHLRRHGKDLMRQGRVRLESGSLVIDRNLLAELLARPAESFL